jgi:hypothetical protein
MARDGNVAAAQFQAGQILEVPFQMLPGKCYAVVAVGAGVQQIELSIALVTPVPNVNPTLAQSNAAGSTASVGGRGNCYKWTAMFGVNAKYVVRAMSGSGIIAAQLYSK